MSKIAEDETDDSFLDLFDLEMRRFLDQILAGDPALCMIATEFLGDRRRIIW